MARWGRAPWSGRPASRPGCVLDGLSIFMPRPGLSWLIRYLAGPGPGRARSGGILSVRRLSTRVSYETLFIKKEPKLILTLFETKRLVCNNTKSETYPPPSSHSNLVHIKRTKTRTESSFITIRNTKKLLWLFCEIAKQLGLKFRLNRNYKTTSDAKQTLFGCALSFLAC